MGRSRTMSSWPVLTAWAALSCGGSTGPLPTPTCKTAGGQPVALTVGQYVSLTPLADAACFIFPDNPSAVDAMQYLVVSQIATSTEGATAKFILQGDTLHPAIAAPPVRSVAAPLGVAERFHDFLRAQERRHYAALPPASPQALVSPRLTPAWAAPPVVGDVRAFSVCSKLDCSSFQSVTATAKSVSGHLAIYVDNAVPAGGLTQAELDSLAGIFDSKLYAVDTTAFGRESDVDANSVVVVLMTGVVNALVTRQQCNQSGFIGGFFFGYDIDPMYQNQPTSNHGEVFYSIVADPTGTLSCPHTASQLSQLVPRTFVHEFQHMISYNQHVLVRGGSAQSTWLDEGLSHLAEELGGHSFLPDDPATYGRFLKDDEYNAYQFLDGIDTTYLVDSSTVPSLAARGAAWMFVRYLTDQFRADTSFAATVAFTRSLEQTSQVGGATVATATGTAFATLAQRWVLANYVSDLPGFVAPPELRYVSWNFRTTFDSLHAGFPSTFPKPFPLTPPVSAGNAVSLAGSLYAGAGVHVLVDQAPSAPGFTLLFSGPGGAALPNTLAPALNVIRLK